MRKANGNLIDFNYLQNRISKNYPKQKWIIFCELMLEKGYKLKLYEARRTFSKYVTVIGESFEFKVRFSNHKPIKEREARGDCDFFVGVSNYGITTTDDAVKAVLRRHNEVN